MDFIKSRTTFNFADVPAAQDTPPGLIGIFHPGSLHKLPDSSKFKPRVNVEFCSESFFGRCVIEPIIDAGKHGNETKQTDCVGDHSFGCSYLDPVRLILVARDQVVKSKIIGCPNYAEINLFARENLFLYISEVDLDTWRNPSRWKY